VELFAQLVLEELDFRIEALNMVELGVAAEHAGADYVRFPRPVPGLVTSRVLVMERLPGAAYTSVEVDKEIGENLLRFAIQGVLEHTLIYGVFHGDLHAGNVLLDSETGRLSLVDFGIVGRLGPEQRMALGQFLVAFAHMDVRAQLEAMVDFGAIPADVDLDPLVAEIERGRRRAGRSHRQAGAGRGAPRGATAQGAGAVLQEPALPERVRRIRGARGQPAG
jgi:ubiquinone biosynthesis protein